MWSWPCWGKGEKNQSCPPLPEPYRSEPEERKEGKFLTGEENNQPSSGSSEKNGSREIWGWVLVFLLVLLIGLYSYWYFSPKFSPILNYGRDQNQKVEELKKTLISGQLSERQDDLVLEGTVCLNAKDRLILFSHPESESYLLDIVAAVQKADQRLMTDLPIKVQLFDDRFENFKFNNYSAPGQTVFISSLTVLSLDSEATAAALWGHELCHIVFRHTAQERRIWKNFIRWRYQFSKDKKSQDLAALNIALGQVIGFFDNQGHWWIGSFPKERELEADSISQEALWKAGYDHESLTKILELGLRFNPERVIDVKTTIERIEKAQSFSQTLTKRESLSRQRFRRRFQRHSQEKLKGIQKSLRQFLENQPIN